jgi:glucosamine kinase
MFATHLLRGPHRPRFLAAVDGGGTATRLRLFEPEGRLLGEGRAGPSALGLGVETAWAEVAQALAAAAEQADLPPPPWSELAIGLGLAGAGSAALAESFLNAHPGIALIALDHDGICSLLGAHGGRPGAVVAAGTGTVGVALRADGSRQLVSGWGWRWGDEGSGGWLGLQAMGLAQQALDGRRRPGALARAVWAQCGAQRADLLAWCRSATASDTAALAPLVFETAAQDAAAERLLKQAALALAQVAAALDAKLPLALLGSIGLRLAERLPPRQQQRLVAAEGDAVDGALHLLRNALETPR